MARKRRRSSSKLLDYAARLLILLGLLAYAPVITWWQSIPTDRRFFLIVTPAFVITIGIAAAIAFAIFRKRERAKIWQKAMAGLQDNGQRNLVVQKQSAIYLSEVELEKFAAQIYKKMGYVVQHVGQTGDHGIDVLLLNPQKQKEIVQCKQWNKPVGEATLRDLYGAMTHERAVRGWLWSPRGFSEPAKAWAKGKPIVLIDDPEINRLIGIAYKNR